MLIPYLVHKNYAQINCYRQPHFLEARWRAELLIALPWPTKLGSNLTSLAIVAR